MIHTRKFEIEIEYFGNPDLPENSRCIGTVKENNKPIGLIAGEDISDVFKELGISIRILDKYKKDNNEKI